MKTTKYPSHTACSVLSFPASQALRKTITAVCEDKQKDTVILLHGLGRTSGSMKFLERKLVKIGFHVENINYPSTRLSIEQIAEQYVAPVVQRSSTRKAPIHFVTHSMGGIIVRKYLSERSPMHIGRIVMVAPPNLGSEIIDHGQKYEIFGKVMGPAALQLSTSPDSFVNRLGTISFPTGIIAGRRSFNSLLSLLIKGDNDGKVSIEKTRLTGMKDHIVVDASHTFIMNKNIVIKHIIHFLKNTTFIHDQSVCP